jgi:hypothetical protein
MAAPSALLEQTARRLVIQSRVNILGFFLPLMITTAALCHLLFSSLSLPAALLLVPLLPLGALMAHRLVRAQRSIRREEVAALLDEKTDGRERFLTYATLPAARENEPFFLLLSRQAGRLAAVFDLSRDIPFVLDRRVPVALSAAVLSVLLLFLLPPTPVRSLLVHRGAHGEAGAELERLARELMRRETVQEQAAGAQLLAVAEQLKDPALSPQDKQRLIEEAQQRFNIKLPLPQFLPFDLQLFASDSNNEQGPGTQSDQPRAGNSPLAKSDQPQEHLQKSPSAAAGDEPFPGPPQAGNTQQASKPRAAGGGVRFNFPQPQPGEKPEQAGQGSAGQRQQASPDQPAAPQGQGRGNDPHRPGGQQAREQGSDAQEQSPGPQPQQPGSGTTVGGATAERFLRPGEQPGGFLTKDAQFVKIRVPVGQDPAGGDTRTAGRGGAVPKTPYSNAPLTEGPPDQPRPRQPIPLEYRAVLQP